MERWGKIIAIFFLGAGTSVFLQNFLLKKPSLISNKPVEITKEATSTAIGKESIESTQSEESVRVKRVIDGDTIELVDGRRVRYIGINTPETVDPRKPVECFGKEARDENKRLVDGKTIRLEKDVSQTDTYGRLLRYVYIGEVHVNNYLVRQGFAHASTFPPDVQYAEQFRLAEQEARKNNRGLWEGCPIFNPTNPTNNPIRPINETMQQFNNVTITPSPGSAQSGCTIKGNISTSGEKIYHLHGCGSYDKTVIDESVGERWFCTEGEAVTAGWRKAKNCP